MATWLSRVKKVLFGVGLGVLLGTAALAVVLGSSGVFMRSAGAWTVPLRVAGRYTFDANVAGLLRLATTPLALRLLNGHIVTTSLGRLRFGRDDRTLVVRCQPCRIDHPRISAQPFVVPVLELRLARRDGDANKLDGQLRGGRAVVGFEASLAASGIDVDWTADDQKLAALYRLLADAIPEAAYARIEGRVTARGTLHLPSLKTASSVRVDGFEVGGLNTERYQYGWFKTTCGIKDGAPQFIVTGDGERRWVPLDAMGALLPAAVLAAEDQRFHEHAGFDEQEVAGVLAQLDAADPKRGASTLSQQAARVLVTGGERSAVRKLRETLYAVEMERTLGKARILELYLNTVDWGPNLCGAKAAARAYFKKSPAKLTPLEAAWLAGILRNPQLAYEREFRNGQPDLDRARWVLMQMRSLPRRERARWAQRGLAFAPAPPERKTALALEKTK
jgi:hypothetical protein